MSRYEKMIHLEIASLYENLSELRESILNFVMKMQIYGKKLSFCHILGFFNSNISETLCGRTLIFQTINSVRSSILSLKYQRFAPSGCNDIGIRKSQFVVKTQLLQEKISCRPSCSNITVKKIFTGVNTIILK